MPTKKLNERKDFIRDWLNQYHLLLIFGYVGNIFFDELWVNNSTLNKGANSRVTSKLDPKGWFIMHSHIMNTIKLAMAGTQEW